VVDFLLELLQVVLAVQLVVDMGIHLQLMWVVLELPIKVLLVETETPMELLGLLLLAVAVQER
jgi:hypothetical protein